MTSVIVVYLALLFVRIATFVAIMPLFATRTPRTVRIVLAVALLVFYVGTVNPSWDPEFAQKSIEIHPVVMALAIIREAIIGAALGFAFGLFLLPARIAGEFVSSQVGLATSPQVGLSSDTPAGAIAILFETTASIVFLELNGHHLLIATLHGTFDKLPLGGGFIPQAALPILNGLSTAQQMGLLLGGPMALCLFMLSIILAIMTRAAPALNVYSVGFTLQVVVVLVGLLVMMPDIIALMGVMIQQLGATMGSYLE